MWTEMFKLIIDAVPLFSQGNSRFIEVLELAVILDFCILHIELLFKFDPFSALHC